MGETSVDKLEGSKEEDPQLCLNGNRGSVEENVLMISEMKLERLPETINPEHASISQLHTGERSNHELFLRRQHRGDLRIPKQMSFISFGEKDLQRCLDFVEFRVSDSVLLYDLETPCNTSMNPKSSKMKFFIDRSGPIENISNTLDSYIVQFPMVAGNGSLVSDTAGQFIVGPLDRKNNVNIVLMSRLIRHFGSPDNSMNLGRLGPIDVKETKCSEFPSSPSVGPNYSSPQKLETEDSPLGNRRHGSKPFRKRLLSSLSNTKTTCSKQLSSSSSTVFQGMLHCVWKSGIPYFVFSVDDQKEVYVSNLLKVDSSDDKDLDYMYLFHSRTSSQKVHGSSDNASDLVGKMKVLNSISLCSNNLKLMETEFVLFGSKENHVVNVQSSVSNQKNKGAPKKVVDMFRANHLFMHRSTPKIGTSSSTPEEFSSDQCEDMCNKLDVLGRKNLLECPQSLELAAIVVKNHLRVNHQEATVGGWGLKFLEKARVQLAGTSSSEASVSLDIGQQTCDRNQSDCSTSMTVLVPAGVHGGPTTKNAGPSSLTGRWRSGGKCDCGGWDIGCPLTILCNRSCERQAFTLPDVQEECSSCDLFKEGSRQDLPIFRMVKIQDGLYVLHFQSTLSPLQAFSIGVANIHSQSNPTLFSKSVKKLKQQKLKFTKM